MQRSHGALFTDSPSDVYECDHTMFKHDLAYSCVFLGDSSSAGIDGIWRVVGDDGWCGVCVGPEMAGE